MLLIRAGQLITGTGEKPIPDASILIDGERIIAAGAANEVSAPVDAAVIDAAGHTVMPGLIDCHVHVHALGGPLPVSGNYAADQLAHTQSFLALRAYRNARQTVAAGFTTIRTLGSPGYVDVALRDAINQGLVEGPRIRAAGQGLTTTGGHMDSGAWAPEVVVSGRTGVGDGPWACRRATREQIKRGADVIKINATVSVYANDYTATRPYQQEMAYEEMQAICEEAHWANLRVAAHSAGGPGVTDAVRAGLDSVEHSSWLTDEQLDLMAEREVFYVPTLLVHTRGLQLGEAGTGLPAIGINWLRKVDDDRWDTLTRAKKAGIKIAVGTDAGFWVYHGENGCELEELVRGGFTPMEAIVAATRTGAECLDLDREIGAIEAGKYADLIVVDGDPLADVRILQEKDKIVQVYKAGKQVK